ncbi:hypothetical protein AGMMS50276_30410 [Synergistales bacterium]|nr:hypothetical protein AGMMS50276_30410 [Synergistales bacterium]
MFGSTASEAKWYGYIDKEGKFLNVDYYESGQKFSTQLLSRAYDFSEGIGTVRLPVPDDAGVPSWEFIDTTGKPITSEHFSAFEAEFKARNPIYRTMYFNEGVTYTIVRRNGEYFLGFLDKTGKILKTFDIGHISVMGLMSDGLAGFYDRRNGVGFMNIAGQIVIPPQFSYADDFHEGLAAVQRKDHGWAYIDKTGRVIIDAKAYKGIKLFSEGLAAVGNETSIFSGKWGFIDKTGKQVTNIIYKRVRPFSEGLAMVAVGSNGDFGYTCGYIDKTGKVVIKMQFEASYDADALMDFREGVAAVPSGRGWIYISPKGETVLDGTEDQIFSSAGPFYDGIAQTTTSYDGRVKIVYIDHKGNNILWFYDSRNMRNVRANVAETTGAQHPKPTKTAMSAFFALCEKGTPQQVEEAIKGGVDVNAKDRDGYTALMATARSNPNPETISLLLKNGADVNAKNRGGPTTLMYAAGFNPNPEIIAVLLKNGADINAKTIDGDTVLMAAAVENPNPEIIALLIKNGADVNTKHQSGRTALMAAAGGNPNPEVISILLKSGADAQASDISRKRAIDYAEKNDKLKGTQAFKQLQEASGVQPSKSTKTAMSADEFLELCKTGALREIEAAIKGGADVNARNEYGHTVLIIAARSNPNSEVIALLLKGGADANIRNKSGKRAIDYARENSRLKGTEALRQLEEASKR